MNPNATSAIIPNPASCSLVIPKPLIPNAPKQNGPIKTPATKYAVTAGKLIFFANLDNNNPASNAVDKLNKIIDVLEPITYLVLLTLCTAFLIDASFNPFLYFRF